MKNIPKRLFTVAVAATTTLAMTAAFQTALKATSSRNASAPVRSMTTKAMPAPQKIKGNKGLQLPKTRTPKTPGLFQVAKSAFAPKKHQEPQKVEGVPSINGIVIYSEGWPSGESEVGFYNVPTGAGQEFVKLYDTSITYGGCATPDFYVGFEYQNIMGWFQIYNYHTYDLTTGEELGSVNIEDGTELAVGCTYDATTDKVFGCSLNDEMNPVLASYSVQVDSYTKTVVGELPMDFNSMACDNTGKLYGIGSDGDLYNINKETAEITKIGAVGAVPKYLSGAVIDQKTNRMYWTLSDDNGGGMYEINTATGAGTLLYDFLDGEEVIGLYIPGPAAEDKAPAAATDLVANFPNGSLSGVISFTAPSTLYDGTAAEGSVHYSVLVNGEEIRGADTLYGNQENIPYDAPQSGVYEIQVVMSNSVGNSPKTKTQVYIGKGVPAASAGVTANYSESHEAMAISWVPVDNSNDGGYIDPAAVTYTVVDQDGNVVAENTTETSVIVPLPMPAEMTSYYYMVTASYDGKSGDPAKSNVVTLGAVVPAYSNDFTNGLGAGWTTLDVNGDDKTWKASEGVAICTYNTSKDMDDWLFTCPIKLEGGKVYMISFAAWGSKSFPERIEVKYGTNTTVDAMTGVLLEPTVVKDRADDDFVVFLTAPADGTYYIGFHGISDADMYNLRLDDFSISAPISGNAPAKISDLKATAGANGETTITLDFTAPSKTLTDNDLTSLTKIEITRGGELVHTISNPAVGSAQSWTDNLAEGGTYEYEVTAFNEDGSSLPAKVSCFCGIDKPVAPESVSIVEDATIGNVTVSWTAVTEDIQGNTIAADKVKYIVATYAGSQWVPVEGGENIDGTTFSFSAVPEGEQDFVQVAVFASTTAGTGKGTPSDMIPVGTPYDGIEESFPDGSLNYIWGISEIGNGSWQIATDATFSDLQSADEDNGFIMNKGQYLEDGGELFSGKIDLSKLVAPGVSFYTYNIVGADGGRDINEIAVSVKTLNGEWVDLKSGTVDDLCEGNEGWNKIIVPLDNYKDDIVQIKFTAVVKQFAYTMFDAIKVENLLAHDLKAGKVAAPSIVTAGESYNVELTVLNEGAMEATGYTVEVKADGEVVKTFEGEPIDAYSSKTFVLEQNMGALATEAVNYEATIIYDADENTANNNFEAFAVSPKVSKLPAVNDLAASQVDGGVKLTWSEPDMSQAVPEPVTIDFEDGEAGSFSYDGWTFVDKDGFILGGFQNVDVPGVTPGETTGAFFIFDANQPQFNTTFAAHGGTKYLASLFGYEGGMTADDWAITPELYGGAQTVSLYARSYSSTYPEALKLYYSTGSTDPDDFVEVLSVAKVPGEWTEYTAELPAGAKYFAIRSCGHDAFMLMVDDVTFIPADGVVADMNIIGYNIYRDGELLNAEPEAECEYVDANVADGNHTYVVTVVYDKGQSAASNAATIEVSGIAGMQAGVSVRTQGRTIFVNGAENVSVISADGKVVYTAKGDCQTTVSAGVYAVKADKKLVKVIVK